MSEALLQLPRLRSTPQLGPEHALVSAVLSRHDSLAGRQMIFREPALPTGFPDIVAVVLTRHYKRRRGGPRSSLSPVHLRLLQHLCDVQSSSFADLLSDLGWRKRDLASTALDLKAAGLIRVYDGVLHAKALEAIFFARRIVAIEAKVRDWRRAIEQARANFWFSSHSFILLPARRFSGRVEDAARSVGVGVLLFDGRSIAIPVKAAERPIPASYGSWLFNEWALSEWHGTPGHA